MEKAGEFFGHVVMAVWVRFRLARFDEMSKRC